eukprot:1160092-Pelagomonas_calceolata.AAC.5
MEWKDPVVDYRKKLEKGHVLQYRPAAPLWHFTTMQGYWKVPCRPAEEICMQICEGLNLECIVKRWPGWLQALLFQGQHPLTAPNIRKLPK